MKPIKIGIVGLGRAGYGMHLNEIENKTDKFKVVAVCDIIEERAKMVADKLECIAYTDIDDLISDNEVEFVDIATRTCDHFTHAKKALLAGKNVFLEKPACMNVDELKALYEISNKPNKPKLYVRQNRRFETGFNELMNIIKSGVLGKVFEVQLFQMGYQRRDDWQTISEFGGGQILNWGPHIIDHALSFLDSDIISLNSDLKQVAAGGNCEDHFSVSLKGENGRLVTLWISGATAINQGRKYIVYGDRGTAEFYNNRLYCKYIDPQQILPEVVSDSGTPGNSFGKSGTFESTFTINWVEKEQTIDTEDLSVIWDYLYDDFNGNNPFPITDKQVLDIMQVITDAKNNTVIKI